jgi:HlyD family secretion protein
VLVLADFASPVEQWRRLGDGYRVEAKFILWESYDVLRVPTSALFRHRDDWTVFVVENGRARLRPIQLGQRGGLAAEVLSPLREGDLVVVHPDDLIEDSTRISVRRMIDAP